YYFSSHDTAATETYSLSLHDALPILPRERRHPVMNCRDHGRGTKRDRAGKAEMMLRNADIESRPHQKPRFLARALRNGFGANRIDRKSTRLNSSHVKSSYAVFCSKKK